MAGPSGREPWVAVGAEDRKEKARNLGSGLGVAVRQVGFGQIEGAGCGVAVIRSSGTPMTSTSRRRAARSGGKGGPVLGYNGIRGSPVASSAPSSTVSCRLGPAPKLLA